ncbi:MAG: hypothetical protein PWQ67_1527 [Clostridia bacterium]|jgi:quercetin dioxygenase-like cupin family protein|nr:hypothetical protein [Clostridia bacterium]MDN5323073.1 hypothetical protein [Clostridia bacterium]
MFVANVKDMEKLEMNGPGINNAFKQVLIGPEQGWQDYVMRLITLRSNGNSPKHQHPWPHINFIVSGNGILYMNGQEYPIKAGSIAYVPNNIEHQYINTSTEDLSFICIVPKEGEK